MIAIEPPRVETWQTRLEAVIVRQYAGAFEWGVRDCATLFADVADALTGADPFAAFRPWASDIAAARALARSGASSVADYIDARFRAVAPSEARQGDVGYVPGLADRLACPAVILGPHAMSWRPDGLIVFDRALITRAFAVGN